MKVFARVILIIFVCNTHSAEIDSVTPRAIELEDGVGELNKITNSRFQEGVKRANDEQLSDIEATEPGEFCDEELLYDSLRKAIFQTRSSEQEAFCCVAKTCERMLRFVPAGVT